MNCSSVRRCRTHPVRCASKQSSPDGMSWRITPLTRHRAWAGLPRLIAIPGTPNDVTSKDPIEPTPKATASDSVAAARFNPLLMLMIAPPALGLGRSQTIGSDYRLSCGIQGVIALTHGINNHFVGASAGRASFSGLVVPATARRSWWPWQRSGRYACIYRVPLHGAGGACERTGVTHGIRRPWQRPAKYPGMDDPPRPLTMHKMPRNTGSARLAGAGGSHRRALFRERSRNTKGENNG